MPKRILSLVATVLCFALLTAACSKPEQLPPDDGQPVHGGTFTLAMTSDAAMLNPILAQDTFSGFLNNFLYDSLLRVDDKFSYRPWLAEAMPATEEGGRKWTFRLRRDVKFHDGQPLTGRDVRFTFEAIQHPGYTGARTSHYNQLKGVAELRRAYAAADRLVTEQKATPEEAQELKVNAWEKWRKESGAIQTPDPYTVIFQFDSPFAPLLAHVASLGILPEHKLREEVGARMKDAAFNRSPIGSGRYTFVEWRPQERIALKANDQWWGGRPYIDQLVWRVFPDVKSAMAALERGAVDSATIAPELSEHFTQNVKHVQLYEYATTVYTQVALNLGSPLFRDVKVRQALSHALDKNALVGRVLAGHGAPAWSHGTPSRWDYEPDVHRYAYDPYKAEVLLNEAGWERGVDGVRVRNGLRLAFDLYVNASEQVEWETAQFLEKAWQRVGVDVTLRGVDFSTLLELSNPANPKRKQPPAYILGWSLGNEPDSYSIWACDGSFNDIGYCSPQVDQLLRQGREEMDPARRKVIYGEVQRRLAEDQPYIWLFFPTAIQGVQTRVKGPIDGTPAGMFWNFEHWWIDPRS